MSVTHTRVEYGGWSNCHRLTNGAMELVVTADVGPRIIRCGFNQGPNLFKEYPEELGGTGEPVFRGRGGHRLWTAPEHVNLSYPADNHPVAIQPVEGGLIATARPEPETRLQKELVIRLDADAPKATVLHRITNLNPMTVEIAAWTLSLMAAGGVGVTGFPPRGTHPEVLPPSNPLILWAFTDLSDPRWIFLRKYLALRQDAALTSPQKIGHFNANTWGAYLLDGEMFLKRYRANPALPYPDFGASFEMFANEAVLELECLGPLTKLGTGETLELTEEWSLHRPAHIREWTDAELDRVLSGLIYPTFPF